MLFNSLGNMDMDYAANEEDIFSAPFLLLHRSGIAMVLFIEYPDYTFVRFSSRKRPNECAARVKLYLKHHFDVCDVSFNFDNYLESGTFVATY